MEHRWIAGNVYEARESIIAVPFRVKKGDILVYGFCRIIDGVFGRTFDLNGVTIEIIDDHGRLIYALDPCGRYKRDSI